MPAVGLRSLLNALLTKGCVKKLEQKALQFCWQVVVKLPCMLIVSRAHFHPTLYKMNASNKACRVIDTMGERFVADASRNS